MIPALLRRFLTIAEPRLLATFVGRVGLGGMRAMHAFRRGLRSGTVVPPFLFVSLTTRCNLRCTGCWVHVHGPAVDLPVEQVDRVIAMGKARGGRLFGLLGGEPLLYPDIWDLLSRHRDCTFQLFTNGTTLTPAACRRMRQLGNVTPLISIEGDPAESDRRRGGTDVFARAVAGLDAAVAEGLIVGVASSLCRTNIDDLLSERFLDSLIDRGVLYAWYYLYRPAGATPSPDLALSAEQITAVRRFLVEMRTRKPILLIDAYWDAAGRAVCPAAMGVSHHVNPAGDIEPCPPIQFARDRLSDGPVPDVLAGSEYLAEFRRFASGQTRGCVLLEAPSELGRFVDRQGARDSSGRGSARQELEAMHACPGHHQPGEEIPERHWGYRFAKKHWFFGFGAYG